MGSQVEESVTEAEGKAGSNGGPSREKAQQGGCFLPPAATHAQSVRTRLRWTEAASLYITPVQRFQQVRVP